MKHYYKKVHLSKIYLLMNSKKKKIICELCIKYTRTRTYISAEVIFSHVLITYP